MEDVPGWTLEELTRRAALALSGEVPAGDRAGVAGGRPRELPDRRAIRWYASIGLVDRPIGGRGRGARYGVRHLSQLVALKRLQAQGWSLADIQGRLAGADDATLLALAALPEQAVAAGGIAGAAAERRTTEAKTAPAPPGLLAGLCLAEGVLLVLPRQPSPADLPALAEAAAPLVAALTALGLVVDASLSAEPTPGAPR